MMSKTLNSFYRDWLEIVKVNELLINLQMIKASFSF